MSKVIVKKSGPDALLVNLGKSIMVKAMILSILGHLVFSAATSTGLVRDWFRCRYCGATDLSGTCPMNQKEVKDKDGVVKYVNGEHEKFGILPPGQINAVKAEVKKELETERRRREQIEKAQREAEEAAKAAAAAAAASNKTVKAESPKTDAKDAGAKDAGAKDAAAKPADGEKKDAAKKDGDGKVTPPEIKPMERAQEFKYGDELDL